MHAGGTQESTLSDQPREDSSEEEQYMSIPRLSFSITLFFKSHIEAMPS